MATSDSLDAQPILSSPGNLAKPAEQYKANCSDEVVTDQVIACISPSLESIQIYNFASAYLELNDLQISNAAGKMVNACSAIHLRALNKWCDRQHESDEEKEKMLVKMLEADRKIKHTVIAKFKHAEGKTFKQKLLLIAKRLNERIFQRFAEEHLNIDMEEIMAELPPRGEELLDNAMGVLKTWRNYNSDDATLGRLLKIVHNATEAGVLKPETRHTLEKIMEKMCHQRSQQMSCANILRKHKKRLVDDMSLEVIEHLIAADLLSKAEIEWNDELLHKAEKREHIIMIIIGHNTMDALQSLKRALIDVNQDELAELLWPNCTQNTESGDTFG